MALSSRSKGLITFKPPHSWTTSDVSYFKIQPKIATIEPFFGKLATELRDFKITDTGYQDFLTADVLEPYSPTGLVGQTVKSALSAIRQIHFGDRSLRDVVAGKAELAAQLLALVGVEGCIVARNVLADFKMCGQSHAAQMDLALVDSEHSTFLLLFVETGYNHPLPRLLAMGIAAYQHNNHIRHMKGVPLLKTMIFPAMTLHESLPCFYLLRVTKALSEAVINGVSPDFVTPAFLHFPSVPPEVEVFGLFHDETRGPVLHILENIKDFIPSKITDIPQGWLRFLTEEDIYEPAGTALDLDFKALSLSHNPAQTQAPEYISRHPFGIRSRKSRNRKSRRSKTG